MTELQRVDLDDFTGGLQTFGSQFNIAPNQSPDMLNIEIDPRGGFRTRKGWARWNADDALGAHFDTTWNLLVGAGDQTVAGNAVLIDDVLYLNDVDSGAVDRSAALAAVEVGDFIFIGSWRFKVTAAVDGTTHWEFTGTATGTTPSAGTDVAINCQIVVNWEPRNAFVHPFSTGAYAVYVANNDVIETSTSTAVFSTLAKTGPVDIVADASPHGADFAAWGDTVYIACGIANPTVRRTTTGTPTEATNAYGNYNNDYTTPDAIGAGAMPRCEFIETHGGYMFVGYTAEAATQPNRIRWSHPSQPENWAELDYIDIDAGGGKITGLRSFQDHLLIFKTDSVWALYGYDSESWQLVRVSTTVGAPTTTAVTASESAVYFYSEALGGGIYAYLGGQAPISIGENLRTVTDEVVNQEDVWLAWAGRRLWCSLPWTVDGQFNDQSTVFVFDPQVGTGPWIAHRSAIGHVKCIIEGSDLQVGKPLAVICGCSGAAALVKLEERDEASDLILEDLTASAFDAYYATGWQYAGWPERRKSWRRPRFIVEQPEEEVGIDLDTYFDYDEGAPLRSHTLLVQSEGTAFWRATGALETGGFDWGDGTLWGASGANGSEIVRATGKTIVLGGLGVNRAIQLRFSSNAAYAGKAWGINLITLKYILRRFTT